MSYAIIRNTNYKMKNLSGIYRHNERKNTHYSNKDISRDRAINNYSIKKPISTYEKTFRILKKEYNIKGQIKKVSNIMCELIITSDEDFFEKIGERETKRFFETAYKFVASYQNLGEEFIVSAKVHMDEKTPHMHLVFVPVVHKQDPRTGEMINKIACSEYWKGKESYKKLQDHFYNYMTRAGFDIERGKEIENREYIPVKEFKTITNYEMQKYDKELLDFQNDMSTKDIDSLSDEEMKSEYKRIIKRYNTIVAKFTRIKKMSDSNLERMRKIENYSKNMKRENQKLKDENSKLKSFINKTFECVSILFDFPIDMLKRIVNRFVKESEKDGRDRDEESDGEEYFRHRY